MARTFGRSRALLLELLERRDVLSTFFQFSQESYDVNENAGAAVITVDRGGDLTGPASVDYAAADGSALAGQDYVKTAGTLTFGNGVASATFEIPIISDAIKEQDETVFLALRNPQGNEASLGELQNASLIIHDAPSVTLTASIQPDCAAEGVPQTFVASVALPPGSVADVYRATLDWGDGTTPTAGSITATAPGFDARAAHVYTSEGSYTLTVVVTLPGGAKQSFTAPVTVGGFVTSLYNTVLDRKPDAAGLKLWVDREHAGVSRTAIADAFWRSPEHRVIEVNDLYQQILHRPADGPGRAFWVGQLLAGVPENAVSIALFSAPEYAVTHPTADAYVRGLYADVFGRAAEAAGLAFWVPILQSGARSRAALASYFLSSAEAYAVAVDAYYQEFLGRPADLAGRAFFVSALARGALTPPAVIAQFLGSAEFLAREIALLCAS